MHKFNNFLLNFHPYVRFQNNCSVQIDVLDIFSDLIFRFGYALSFSYPTLKNSLIPHLKTQRNSISKRAINCLAGITITCDDKIFKEIIDHVIGELDRPLSTNQAKVFLNCLTSICKHSGGRIRSYVDTIVTLNKKFIDTQDDELIEACLLMFEIFVRRCPQEMNSHLSKVLVGFFCDSFLFLSIFSPGHCCLYQIYFI